MTSLLQQVDLFVRKKKDDSTRTTLGGLLSVFLPIVVIGYSAYQGYVTSQKPPLIDSEVLTSWSQVFVTDFTCVAPQGCLVSLNYAGESSSQCRESIIQMLKSSGNEQALSVWKSTNEGIDNSCINFNHNAVIKLPYCYTPDTIDGPTFMWKRSQTCTDFGDLKSSIGAATNNGKCVAGVQVIANSVDRKNGSLTKRTLPLFPGIHIFNLNFVVVNFNGVSALEVIPVTASDTSDIATSNTCCSPSSGYGCQFATANDYFRLNNSMIEQVDGEWYQAKIRLLPSFQSISVTRENVFADVVVNIGSVYNIVFVVFNLFVLIHLRAIFKQDQQERSQKLSTI